MADLLNVNILRVTDDNDDPVSGAEAYFYESGTSTPLTVYSDNALTTPHASPLVADSNGVFAAIYVASGTAVKVDIQDPDTAASLTGYPKDPVFLIRSADATAESISATPHTGVSSTTVQAQLEEIQGNISANTGNAQTIVLTGGSSNAYTLTASDTISSYSAGQEFLIRINHANTGASTLNVDSLGAKDLQKYDSSNALAAVASGDLQIGAMYRVHYDGTRFILSDTIIRDDDTLSGDDRSAPSSESVKAYVDAQITAQTTLGSSVATTSGSTADHTMSAATPIAADILLNAVSTDGTANLELTLGDSGGIEVTGYATGRGDDVNSFGGVAQTEFKLTRSVTAGSTFSGVLRLVHFGSNLWGLSGTLTQSNGSTLYIAGSKTLTGDLTTIRLQTGDTFDAGGFIVREYY